MKSGTKINPRRGTEQGVVLIVTLIMLVAMTLAGIALIRSVHTTTLIAGNLAMQQSALASGTVGTETAVNWLTTQLQSSGLSLDANILTQGYSAQRRIPPAGMSWEAYWTNTLAAQGVVTLPTDAAGNSVQYVIDRMCNGSGQASDTTGSGCAISVVIPPSTNSGKGVNAGNPKVSSYVFYRVIARIQGPRSTTSFIETMVAI